MPGGKRPGAGRPKNSKNKRTVEREAAVQQAAAAISETIPGAFEGDAHAFLMLVYKDPAQPCAIRIDAAKAALKVEKPALQSVAAKTELTGNLEVTISDRQRAKAIAALIAKVKAQATSE